mgnify:CR=1 FL=1
MEKAIFGAGCFWHIQDRFKKVKGVSSTSVGYSGGKKDAPTYEQVCTGDTGHAEVVEVDFDPSVVTYSELLDVFWSCHDPTTKDRQGPDIGHQYRSVIYYLDDRQKKLAEYTEDVKMYKWKTSRIGRDFNFYAAIDSLNSIGFNEMIKQYTAEFQSLLNKVTDTEFIVEAKEKIKKTTDSWLERKAATDKMPKEGEPAIDFIYPDKDGNEFSLANFKGTLIYVDVWATWCGPCRAEIPYLQKLEEEYHGDNITFLSVSVDTDKDAWLKMVKEKELGGTQLWADGWSEITKSYAIFGIPRFMLFSADGNVISTNAPRPSSDEIRGLLDANLGGAPNL